MMSHLPTNRIISRQFVWTCDGFPPVSLCVSLSLSRRLASVSLCPLWSWPLTLAWAWVCPSLFEHLISSQKPLSDSCISLSVFHHPALKQYYRIFGVNVDAPHPWRAVTPQTVISAPASVWISHEACPVTSNIFCMKKMNPIFFVTLYSWHLNPSLIITSHKWCIMQYINTDNWQFN